MPRGSLAERSGLSHPIWSQQRRPLLIFASLPSPTKALYGLGAAGSTAGATLALEIHPEEER